MNSANISTRKQLPVASAMQQDVREFMQRELRIVAQIMLLVAVIVVLVGLSACSHIEPRVALVEPTTFKPVAQTSTANNNGAIFQQASYRPVFEDPRARLRGGESHPHSGYSDPHPDREGARPRDPPDFLLACDPGPLAHLVLGRDGTYYVVAAGKANHAGIGVWNKMQDVGNSRSIGIEAENNGLSQIAPSRGEPWPERQMVAYAKGVAAILGHLKLGVDRCVAHKEYAPKRKIDPSFSMWEFRRRVAKFLN